MTNGCGATSKTDAPSSGRRASGTTSSSTRCLTRSRFSYSFRDTRAADLAFASNLLGALVGGTLEYVALLVGFQQLLLLVALLYALAYLLAERWRLFADRALEPALATSS